MWQATLNDKYPVSESVAYINRRGFRASQLDGYRILSRRMGSGRYLTFCSKRIVNKLAKSDDWGTFVCDHDVDQKLQQFSSDDTCAICLGAINDERDTFLSDCGHTFHRSCVLHAWEKHNIDKCAMCRQHFPEWFWYDGPVDKDESDWLRLKLSFHKYHVTAPSTRSTPR